MSDLYRHFDGMCWPAKGERLTEIQWQLRYGDPVANRFVAASIVDAYAALIDMTAKRRNEIIRELRKGPRIPK